MRRHRAQFEIRHIMVLVAISAPACAFVAWLPNPGRFVLFAVLCYLTMFVATLTLSTRLRRWIDTPWGGGGQNSGSESRDGPTPPDLGRDRPGEGGSMRVQPPRLRITKRQLVVAVTWTAMLLGLTVKLADRQMTAGRTSHYQGLSSYHAGLERESRDSLRRFEDEARRSPALLSSPGYVSKLRKYHQDKVWHHALLKSRYAYASRYPLSRVPPDPPPPDRPPPE